MNHECFHICGMNYLFRLADLHVDFGVDNSVGPQNVLSTRSGKKGDIYDVVGYVKNLYGLVHTSVFRVPFISRPLTLSALLNTASKVDAF